MDRGGQSKHEEVGPLPEPRVRTGVDADSAGVIEVIARVFAEYPGCVLDVDAEEPQLKAPASSFDGFWVVEVGPRVVGCVACALSPVLARD